MKAYLAIKFHSDNKNRQLIENIISLLKKNNIDSISMARDKEKWGKVKFEPNKLMLETFKIIDKSDFVLVELTEKGIGLGIEAGYAFAKKIPIITIAKYDSDISTTLKGISKIVYLYKDQKSLTNFFSKINL